jgi:O-antigen/teichoic acid export membrane protein
VSNVPTDLAIGELPGEVEAVTEFAIPLVDTLVTVNESRSLTDHHQILRYPVDHPPERPDQSSQVLSTAFVVASLASLLAGAGFLVVAAGVLAELGLIARSPEYAILFLLLTVAWTLTVLYDAALTALRRADRIILRSLVQGATALITLVTGGLFLGLGGIHSILLGWIAALVVSCALAFIQIRRILPGHRYEIAAPWTSAKTMLRVGVPNHHLSLALLAPVWLLPVLVAETLGAEANAYWYAVWMVGLLVMIAPNASAQALFAEASSSPHLLQQRVSQALTFSLFVGVVMAIGIVLTADWVLGFLGDNYADAGATPLRILALAVVPRTLIEVYVIIGRATNRLKQPTILAVTGGTVSIVAAMTGAILYGLPGVAIGWVIAQYLACVWAALRVRQFQNVRQGDTTIQPPESDSVAFLDKARDSG